MTKILTKKIREYLKVYFIMGSNNCKIDPTIVLKEAIAGGITLFQFREKGEGALIGEDKRQLALRLQQICKEHRIPFIVNDDVELAMELDADGVHVGQDDEVAKKVRQMIGKDKLLGVSAHNLKEAKMAIEHGADYLGIGPIYPTTSKKDAKAVQGTRLIEEIREQHINIPIVGIGGITPKNAKLVILGGADGVSVISAISLAESPLDVTNQIYNEVSFKA